MSPVKLLLAKIVSCIILVAAVAVPMVVHGTLNDELKALKPKDFKRLYADSWRAVGGNIIIEGNAYLPVSTMEVYADKIVVNMDNQDFEAVGNVRIFRWQDGSAAVSLKRLAELEKEANMLVRNVSSSLSRLGERTYTAEFSFKSDQIYADRITGNLATGYFSMVNPSIRYTTFTCKASYGERASNGEITLHDAEISSCNYLESDNAHYSIAASEVKLTPPENPFYEIEHAEFKPGDMSVLLFNGMVKIYGVPVLWLPAFFKPRDEHLGLAGMQFGRESDWGFYINLYRTIYFHDAPEITGKLHFDWYEKRGFGYGIDGRIVTPESRTDIFVYSIYDRKQYKTDDYFLYRQDIPHSRYDFRVSNITHITPLTDFRGVFDYQSDPYFKRDFFERLYNHDPQPATFFAMEQQFERFSLSGYMSFRVNDFYTTVEKMPQVRMDIPRQEIFNTGIYYQGDFEAAYMRKKWIEFDEPAPKGYSTLKDYDAFRFDMTHFFYYPIANKYFSLVPRIGFKLTTYSHTSDKEVDDKDLKRMFAAAEPQNMGRYRFNNYDSDGGSKVRFAMELGFELSTKLHNTWQDLRSEFFRIDGLRHIIQPYVNYTFIPKPTLNRKHIYFFDDIDRITKQNFFRFGLINRLQTRSGNNVVNLLYMENYWDIHMEEYDGMSALGNVGTILSWRIFKGLSLNTEFLIDISGDGEIKDTYRHGRNAGKTGLALDWLNYWDINLTYSPAKNWKFSVGYNYVRPYDIRSAYSMGSTLTQINSASYFEQYNTETDESFYIRTNFPITPDERTFGSFQFTYDVKMGSIDTFGFGLLRRFHCWQLMATLEFEREYDYSEKGWDMEVNYSVTANLTGLNDAMNNVQNSVLQELNSSIANIKF